MLCSEVGGERDGRALSPCAFLRTAVQNARSSSQRPCAAETGPQSTRRGRMVEKNPWWRNVDGPFPESYGCVGVKADGGGSMAGHGLVGPMRLHRACNMRDMVALEMAIEAGDNVNEVEAVCFAASAGDPAQVRRPLPPHLLIVSIAVASRENVRPCACDFLFCEGGVTGAVDDLLPSSSSQAGNIPLHNCAYEGWVEGAKFLLQKGAKINASNNVSRRTSQAPRSHCASQRIIDFFIGRALATAAPQSQFSISTSTLWCAHHAFDAPPHTDRYCLRAQAGDTPLSWAMAMKNDEMARTPPLLNHRASSPSLQHRRAPRPLTDPYAFDFIAIRAYLMELSSRANVTAFHVIESQVEFLLANGARKEYQGNLIVPEHVDKVKVPRRNAACIPKQLNCDRSSCMPGCQIGIPPCLLRRWRHRAGHSPARPSELTHR